MITCATFLEHKFDEIPLYLIPITYRAAADSNTVLTLVLM
jgi:hypothetical protein